MVVLLFTITPLYCTSLAFGFYFRVVVTIRALKARNDEWVGARPDVGSTVLLWMQDIAHPKGIATEKRFLYRRGKSWIGLWPG
jgi:hypothetical protein